MHRKACGFIDYHQLAVVVNDAAVDSLRPAIWNTSPLFPWATEMGGIRMTSPVFNLRSGLARPLLTRTSPS